MDSTFTTRERAIILTAADYLERSGGLRYRITFDLEPDAAALEVNRIWRPALDSAVVTTLDARFGRVLGATVEGHPFRMWLLPERTPGTYTFLHVVEHELLHAVGCHHVADEQAIMYAYTRPGVEGEGIRLSNADRAEITRALGN